MNPTFPSLCMLAALLTLQGAEARPLPAAGLKPGEQVYKQVCIACHGTGVANAPKFGDRDAWKPLIAEGQHVVTGHAWVGVRAMPARGGSSDITLEEFARAVAYMASHAGGNWKEPDAAMIRKIAREADKQLSKSIEEQEAMQEELRHLLEEEENPGRLRQPSRP